MKPARTQLWYAWAALAAVAVVYAPALRNDFVWDDFALVLGDPFVRSWRNIADGWFQRLFFDLTGSEFFRPLQRLSFTLDYAIHELAPAGFHATNIALHLAAMAALAWGALPLLARWRNGTDLPPRVEPVLAWGAALVWGIHPLLTSAVTYVAGRADPLAALFTWVALGVLARALGRPEHLRVAALFIAATLSLAAALSKESGLLSFALCTLVMALGPAGRRTWLTWGVLALAAIAAYAWQRAQLPGPGPGLGPVVPWVERPRLIVEALAEYARLVVAPIDLLMDRCGTGELPSQRASLPGWALTAGGICLLGAVLRLGWRLRQRPVERTLWLGALLTYLPISNVFSLNASVAEHWLYQPLQWTALLAAVVLARHLPRWSPFLQRATIALILGWVALLGLRTFWRQADWRNEEEFFTATIAAGGNSPRMLANLARVRSALQPEAAVELYEEALRRSPKFQGARVGLARLQLKLGRVEKAGALLHGWEPDPTVAAGYWLTRSEYVRAAGLGSGRQELSNAAKTPGWRTQRALTEALIESGQASTALPRLFEYCEAEPFRAEAWQFLADQARKAGLAELQQIAQQQAWERDVHLRRRQERAGRP